MVHCCDGNCFEEAKILIERAAPVGTPTDRASIRSNSKNTYDSDSPGNSPEIQCLQPQNNYVKKVSKFGSGFRRSNSLKIGIDDDLPRCVCVCVCVCLPVYVSLFVGFLWSFRNRKRSRGSGQQQCVYEYN